MIPVFEASPNVAFRLQDEIRAHMLARIPRMPAAQPDKIGNAGGHAKALKAELRRQHIAPEVIELRRQGATIEALARRFKVAELSIKRILLEASQ